jgi:dihydroxy-acid dehydratase
MSLPYSSSYPAQSAGKQQECKDAGSALRVLLERDIKPRDIMTKEAFENALVLTMVMGGSTNAVLHLLAMAHTVGVKLTLEDIQRVSDATPLLANLKPSGEYVMEDLQHIGGTPAVLKYLLAHKRLHGGCMTVTGKTLADTLKPLPGISGWGALGPVAQNPTTGTSHFSGVTTSSGAPARAEDILRPLETPIKTTGHIAILRGNIAPGGSVAKITGKEGLAFTGRAAVFDGEHDFLAALERGDLHAHLGRPRPAAAAGTKAKATASSSSPTKAVAWTAERLVILIRYEGPKGGPGMPEMLTPTSAIMGAGLGDVCALLTDGRFSGGSHGFIVGHIVPEAAEGGPIALVRSGDTVTIDAERRAIDATGVSEAEWAARRKAWVAPKPKATSGYLSKFIRLTRSASEGCITDA